MERRPAEIEVDAIIITDEKAAYFEAVHDVTRADVWAVLGLAPRYLVDGQGRYSMVGRSAEGRYLMVGLVPTSEEGAWRLVTAYWLRESRGRRLYGG